MEQKDDHAVGNSRADKHFQNKSEICIRNDAVNEAAIDSGDQEQISIDDIADYLKGE